MNKETAPPQQQAEPPPEWPLIKNILDVFGLDAIAFVADWKAAQQQAEPVMINGLTEAETNATASVVGLTKQAEPVAWDKPSDNFNEWWDVDYEDPANPFEKDSAAYWAWAGWKAAQRPWVGLTEQDMPSGEDPMFDHRYFIAGLVYADKVLKERNT